MKNLMLLILFALPSWVSEFSENPEPTTIIEKCVEEDAFLCYNSTFTVTNVTITLGTVEFQVQEFETADVTLTCCPLMLLSGLPSCMVTGISLNSASEPLVVDPPSIVGPRGKEEYTIKFEVEKDMIVERIGVDEETGAEKSRAKIKVFAGKYFLDSSGENNINQTAVR